MHTLGQPGRAGASMRTGADARERIHRFAGVVHQAIDNIEQKLNSQGRGAQAKYAGQARQYGEQLRAQITARPMQCAGIALGAGVILDRLFSPAPKVRLIHVPARKLPSWEPAPSARQRAMARMHDAGAHVQDARRAGREAVGRAGAAAGLGLAGTTAMASRLTQKASTVPLQMRLATQRLLARSQQYGTIARTGLKAHPLIGLGAVLGLGALATTFWMRRRRPAPGTTYITVDEEGNGLAWQRDRYDVQLRPASVIASRPVASAAVMLGLGVLVGALLKRP